MEHTWGTPETQPPQTTPEPPELVRFHAAHAWLLLGAVSIAVSVGAAALDHEGYITVSRGVFSILAALSVGGFCAWTVQSAEVRNRRGLSIILGAMCQRQREGAERQRQMLDKVEELTAAVERLERQLSARQPPRNNEGHRYVGTSAPVEADITPLGTIVAPEAEAALRRIDSRLRLIKRVNRPEQG